MQLQLSVNPPALTEDAFDVCIRFGAPPDSRVIARQLAPNRRLLCAAPAYLARHGIPKVPNDLTKHNCIGIRQGEEAYGVWRLASGRGRSASTESVRTRGNPRLKPLSSRCRPFPSENAAPDAGRREQRQGDWR